MISSKKKQLIVPLLSILLLILILPPSTVHAAILNSAPVVDPPTIDGTFDSLEWFWANHQQFDAVDALGGPTSITVNIWLMNNENYLYLCIQWPDPSVTDWDTCALFFDEVNTGNWCVNYNNVLMWTWYPGIGHFWQDAYVDLAQLGRVSIDVGSQDGQVNSSHDAVGWTLEIAMPLAMPAAEDLSSQAGSTIGIYFYFDRVSSGFEYPAAGGGFLGNGSSVSLQLSSLSVVNIGIPYTFVLVIFSIAVLAYIIIHRKRLEITLPSSRF